MGMLKMPVLKKFASFGNADYSEDAKIGKRQMSGKLRKRETCK